MPRRPREDEPGLWHHVMNRGIARRTVFETHADVRYFLSRVAWRVHAGEIELHSFCVLTTHFHLLVRCPGGRLSEAMRRIQNEYTRWFNRMRQRDGPLFRGRFRSRAVRTMAYRRHLVRYIDSNPVLARLVATPELHPHGSARWYATGRGPVWLERSWVESVVAESTRSPRDASSSYACVFGEPLSPNMARWIEKRLLGSKRGVDPLDDLIDAAKGRVLDWMQRKADLADGTCAALPICSEEDVTLAVEEARARFGDWCVSASRKSADGWTLARTGLLRELAGNKWREIASRTGVTASAAWKHYERHRGCLQEDAEYAKRIEAIAEAAIVRCHSGDAGTTR